MSAGKTQPTQTTCPVCGTAYHDGTRNPSHCRICGGKLEQGASTAAPAISLLPLLATASAAAIGAFAACAFFLRKH